MRSEGGGEGERGLFTSAYLPFPRRRYLRLLVSQLVELVSICIFIFFFFVCSLLFLYLFLGGGGERGEGQGLTIAIEKDDDNAPKIDQYLYRSKTIL